jgi:hypothetical protein
MWAAIDEQPGRESRSRKRATAPVSRHRNPAKKPEFSPIQRKSARQDEGLADCHGPPAACTSLRRTLELLSL